MITFIVTGQDIVLEDITFLGNPLVSGTVKEYICKFVFDESWEGYAKTAVFRVEESTHCACAIEPESIELAILDDDTCVLPAESLKPDTKLMVGVYGVKDDKVKPTVYSSPMLVRMGAVPTQAAIDPDPGIYEQILVLVQETKDIAQSVRDDADAGKFDGKPGKGVPPKGRKGQILAKKTDEDYDTDWVDSGAIGVQSWNGRKGEVLPQNGDYDYKQITGLESKLEEAKKGATSIHKQRTISKEWKITHNLNKFPSVTVADSAGTVVVGEVYYNDANNLTIKFNSGFSGIAYLN